MSAATGPSGEATSARPVKPPPPAFARYGIVAFVLVTVVFAWDWEYGIGFSPIEVLTNLSPDNPVVQGLLDIDWSRLTSENVQAGFLETFQMAVLATIIGGLVAFPLALYNSVVGAPNKLVYVLVKNFNSIVRAVPDLIYAAFFVAAIGRSPLAGTIALALLSIGVIAKLTSDTVDGIDHGPVEAARAAGASHTQMVRTAVVPQVLANYASFALYTFEINLRGSAVLAFVGAGGIGFYLQSYYGRGQYDRVWGVVLGFFLVVFVVDRISVAVRRRLL